MITAIIVIGAFLAFCMCWALAKAADDGDDYLDFFEKDKK